MASLYSHQTSNKRRTWLLFSVFLILVIGIGWYISYVYQSAAILYIAVGFSIIMNITAYWFSDKIVLKMSNAKPADEDEYSELHNIVENLAITAGLPKPKVYIVHENQPNAFATGRNPEHGVIAVTDGLLKKLNRSELEGVIAHEMSHIGNRDMLVSTAAVVLVGFISILSDLFMRSFLYQAFIGGDRDKGSGWLALVGIIVAILAPLGAALIQLAISRKREFLADASGALLTRYPDGLANALQKIHADNTKMKDSAKNATAHLWLSNPFKGEKFKGARKLFMTHPPIEDRIEALKGMDIEEE